MSDYIVGGRADQGIQQFVNQSPWEWAPVRRDLAGHVTSIYRPDAWVINEVVLPKNGSNSAGVERQYAPSAGRVMNCQLGLGLFFVGDSVAPVNWRLLLPPQWAKDAGRRARAHIPDDEEHKTRWQYIIDMIDEMTFGWELDPAPIVVDARHDTRIEPLLRAFEARSLPYVVRVAAGTPVATGHESMVTAGELAALHGRNGNGTTSLNWSDNAGGPTTTSRFVLKTLPRQVAPIPDWRIRPRHLLAEWPHGHQRPNDIWLTNLNAVRMPQLISLARTQWRTRTEMARLCDDFGLTHFEGRSFRGWHHHTTLVSLAHSYAMTQESDSRDERLRLRA